MFVCLSVSTALGSLNVIKKKQFSDDRWTRGRIVSAIDWSPHVSTHDHVHDHTSVELLTYHTLYVLFALR